MISQVAVTGDISLDLPAEQALAVLWDVKNLSERGSRAFCA